MNLKKMSLNNNYLCFTVMIIFSLICTLKMADFCLSGGILNPDISLYSISALKYAGIDYYNVLNPMDLVCTPVISFLTSLIFRLGLVDKSAIIIVTSIFGFFGFVGLYFLLKTRFNSMLSLLGVIIYGSTSVVIFNLSKGLIDIPALTVSIWVIYFVILAINKNPKYFLIVFPLWVIGFFTKYVAGFTLPVICLYYLMNKDFIGLLYDLFYDRNIFKQKLKNYFISSEFKYICFSIVLSIILAIIICKTLILDFGGSLSFFEQSISTFNGNSAPITRIYNPDKSFYLDYFTDFLYLNQGYLGLTLANIFYIIFGIGLILNFLNYIKNFNFIQSQKISYKIKNLRAFLVILFLVFSILSFYGFYVLLNNMFSNIFILCAIFTLYLILSGYPIDKYNLRMNLLFLTFFMVNFIFVSIYPQKTFRYALPLLPPFIYAIIWALDSIFNFLTNGFDNEKTFIKNIHVDKSYSRLSNAIAIVLIVVLLFSTFSFMLPMEFNRSNDVYQEVLYCGYATDLEDSCDFIIESDADYHSKTFASFIHSERIIRFNMNVNVTMLDENDPQLSNFNDTDYLILYKDLKLKNYNKIADFEDFHVYYHK